MKPNTTIQQTHDRLLHEGIVVAIRLTTGEPLVDVCRALADGGLRVLEITLTTPGALEAIEALATDPGLLVGGGTVLSTDDARRVADAGGRFALSPVFDAVVIDEAHRLNMLAIPGASTPAEMLAAHRHGARVVKVFPSGPLGGPEYLRLVRGPLPDIPIMPTSGPTADTLAEYMTAGAVAVGVGGKEFFAPGFTLDAVTTAARRARHAMDAWRSDH